MFSPVCHGCSTGKEFITTFLPNYQSSGRNYHRLHVVLTAQGSEAEVHIQVRILFLIKVVDNATVQIIGLLQCADASILANTSITVKTNSSRPCSKLDYGSPLHPPNKTLNIMFFQILSFFYMPYFDNCYPWTCKRCERMNCPSGLK